MINYDKNITNHAFTMTNLVLVHHDVDMEIPTNPTSGQYDC